MKDSTEKLAMAISAYLDRSIERRDRIAERTKQIYVEQIEESRDALQLARELNEIMREENGERQP